MTKIRAALLSHPFTLLVFLGRILQKVCHCAQDLARKCLIRYGACQRHSPDERTPEIARSDKRSRALTSEQVRNDIRLIAALHPAKGKRTARSRAILTFSALVGAMSLARAVSDEALSREILNTVAELLKDSA